jgi:hypothetical protein
MMKRRESVAAHGARAADGEGVPHRLPGRDLVRGVRAGDRSSAKWLAPTRYEEGKNIAIAYQFAEADYDRLPALAMATFEGRYHRDP